MAINLLLVGRTGNGKRSTGNSILGKKVFMPSLSNQSAVLKVEKETSGDGQITVVPGIGDYSLDDFKGISLTINSIEELFRDNSNDFSAILFVLPFGERFTKQETDAVMMMKGILGRDVLRKHGGIVMTRGDNFDVDDEEIKFEDWCKNQTGDFKELLEDCDFRCALFDNRTKDSKKLKVQRDKLLELLKEVKKYPYTSDDYSTAKTDRKRLLANSKRSILERDNRDILDRIKVCIDHVNISGDPTSAIEEISSQQVVLDNHKKYLEKEADGTDVAKQFLIEVHILDCTLRTKLEMAKAELKLRDRQNRYNRKSSEEFESSRGRDAPTSQQEGLAKSREIDVRNKQHRMSRTDKDYDNRIYPTPSKKKTDNAKPTSSGHNFSYDSSVHPKQLSKKKMNYDYNNSATNPEESQCHANKKPKTSTDLIIDDEMRHGKCCTLM